MTAGYKGVVHNHPGYVSCPTNPFKPTHWKDKLRELELKFARWLKVGNVSREEGLEDVNLMMRSWYPGNYRVVELYPDPDVGVKFQLVFDDPKEETMWLLRWS